MSPNVYGFCVVHMGCNWHLPHEVYSISENGNACIVRANPFFPSASGSRRALPVIFFDNIKDLDGRAAGFLVTFLTLMNWLSTAWLTLFAFQIFLISSRIVTKRMKAKSVELPHRPQSRLRVVAQQTYERS
ncbi:MULTISPECIES: hypothetical protein [Rhizobium]|uniref:hypothetical protein n=1 Tax=Rhizobium TaxID=379 RepID=UPI0013001A71|nr:MULTISPECIES: hypothetical protein [Rhizobium]MCS0458639.1 hypothetical protein [Rhizobium favelukesii]UFS79535.1 hypothetical protein LPB79_08265 [Rhizobium sp. T136]